MSLFDLVYPQHPKNPKIEMICAFWKLILLNLFRTYFFEEIQSQNVILDCLGKIEEIFLSLSQANVDAQLPSCVDGFQKMKYTILSYTSIRFQDLTDESGFNESVRLKLYEDLVLLPINNYLKILNISPIKMNQKLKNTSKKKKKTSEGHEKTKKSIQN